MKSYRFQAAEPRPELRSSDYKPVPFQLCQKANQQEAAEQLLSCHKTEFASSFCNRIDDSR
jgi:hypothetical protein